MIGGEQGEHEWDRDQSKPALCVKYQEVYIIPNTVYVLAFGPGIAFIFWRPTNLAVFEKAVPTALPVYSDEGESKH